MKTRSVLFLLALACLPVISAAQGPQMPKAGLEHKRLQYYAGTWTSEYDIKAMGAAGKTMATDVSQMMPGGFFLVTHTEGKGGVGELKGLAVMGYDADSKSYTYDSYNNFGEAEHFKGTVEGDTWTWTGESKNNGKSVSMRFIAKEASPTMYTMKLEMMAGGKWVTVMEGKSTKTK